VTERHYHKCTVHLQLHTTLLQVLKNTVNNAASQLQMSMSEYENTKALAELKLP